jgi:hypothetical protein
MAIRPNFIREAAFDSKIQFLSKTFSRMDELDRAIEWALERDAKRFYNICDDFFLWKTGQLIPEVPPLRILYRYVEMPTPTIYLIAAELA